MKTFLSILSAATLFIGSMACTQQNETTTNALAFIPQPKEMQVLSDQFQLTRRAGITIETPNPELERIAHYFNSKIAPATGFELRLKQRGNIRFKLTDDTSLGAEGYHLLVKHSGVTITAHQPAGIFYGVQTLLQMFPPEIRGKEEQKNKVWKIACVDITDKPQFAWRGMMLDVSRHWFTKEDVKKYIDELAEYKMNVFHWHLTNDQGWRIEIKKYPKLTEIGAFRDSSEINHFGSDVYDGKPHGGFYTQDDLREIVAYAAQRHITIVPEVSMPGHSCAAIASYPWLGTSGKQIKVPGKFGVHYEVLNVADPKVMTFLSDVMDEVIAIFPGAVFHIGGDEVKYDQWKNSPAIRAYMAKHQLKTPAELQVYFTNEVSNMLASKGKRMMGWNEITGAKLHEFQSDADTKSVEQQLAPGTIVHFWKGDTALIRETIEKGYDIVNSYHVYTYIDYSYESIPLEKAYAFDPVPAGLTDEQKKRVLGLGCQMWGEFIPTVESMNLKVYPRIAAYAETGWTAFNRFQSNLNFFLDKWKKEGIVYGPGEGE